MVEAYLEKFQEQSEFETSHAKLSPELGAILIENKLDASASFKCPHEPRIIQFFLLFGGEADLVSGDESVKFTDRKIATHSAPFGNSLLELQVSKKAKAAMVFVTVDYLHTFFGSEFATGSKAFADLRANYKIKKKISSKLVHPGLGIVAYQMFNTKLQGLALQLYKQSKGTEFLSLYLDEISTDEAVAKCPFIKDNVEAERITEAKQIVMERMAEPPSLKELARTIGTNEFKLKAGFKSMFGTTVYGFLNDYRMETARKLLEIEQRQIKDISNHVGYSNPSHFIAAYKKKFGITPKKYSQRLQ